MPCMVDLFAQGVRTGGRWLRCSIVYTVLNKGSEKGKEEPQKCCNESLFVMPTLGIIDSSQFQSG